MLDVAAKCNSNAYQKKYSNVRDNFNLRIKLVD
jgi:hypothetical protein